MVESKMLSLHTYKYSAPMCPNCRNQMEGFSADFHYLQCPNCDSRLQSVKIQATQDFQWVIAGVCLLLFIGAIAEIFS